MNYYKELFVGTVPDTGTTEQKVYERCRKKLPANYEWEPNFGYFYYDSRDTVSANNMVVEVMVRMCFKPDANKLCLRLTPFIIVADMRSGRVLAEITHPIKDTWVDNNENESITKLYLKLHNRIIETVSTLSKK